MYTLFESRACGESLASLFSQFAIRVLAGDIRFLTLGFPLDRLLFLYRLLRQLTLEIIYQCLDLFIGHIGKTLHLCVGIILCRIQDLLLDKCVGPTLGYFRQVGTDTSAESLEIMTGSAFVLEQFRSIGCTRGNGKYCYEYEIRYVFLQHACFLIILIDVDLLYQFSEPAKILPVKIQHQPGQISQLRFVLLPPKR